ncbi:MAG: hypothetical protein JWM00_711 [Candidatus Saccharibacteria bacterium]|nr:hypothetical protein [Candidatus Saccharibacteria bacterium]
MNEEYKLIPLQKTQSIPVSWRFTQEEYDNMAKGHRSNWCVFLRDDVVHVCRIGGEEFYRFTVSKTGDGVYATDDLEAYIPDDFYESARQHGWTDQEIERHQAELRESVIEETVGLLASYFNINTA